MVDGHSERPYKGRQPYSIRKFCHPEAEGRRIFPDRGSEEPSLTLSKKASIDHRNVVIATLAYLLALASYMCHNVTKRLSEGTQAWPDVHLKVARPQVKR